MKGAIVTNGYLRGGKFEEPTDMMVAAAARQGIALKKCYNNELCVPLGDVRGVDDVLDGADFVIFWDKDVRLAINLEMCCYNLFNSSECIRVCDDKFLTHTVLAKHGVPSIKTVAGPMSFGMDYEDWMPSLKEKLDYPIVVKDCFGSFGEQVRLVRNDDELMDLMKGSVPRIFQEYIECGSEDIRLEVVGNEVVAAVRRVAAEGDFRSNASAGGTMHLYDPTEEERRLAINASKSVEADFCGVDIIRSEDGPVVCEVNSNAHIKNLKNCTGIDVSDAIIEHIVGCI